MAAAEHQVGGQVYSLFREPQRGIMLTPWSKGKERSRDGAKCDLILPHIPQE